MFKQIVFLEHAGHWPVPGFQVLDGRSVPFYLAGIRLQKKGEFCLKSGDFSSCKLAFLGLFTVLVRFRFARIWCLRAERQGCRNLFDVVGECIDNGTDMDVVEVDVFIAVLVIVVVVVVFVDKYNSVTHD